LNGRWLVFVLLLLNFLMGAQALMTLKPVPIDPRLGRPSFCEMEKIDQ
jgi:hypothetical protein